MPRTTLDLGGRPWQFGQVPRQPFSSQPLDDRTAVAEWLPASVPGDVRADLLAAGRIPPLDTPDHIVASGWVDDADWWYRTEIDAVAHGTTLVLEADGIDYLSGIWLDGQLLGTHEGMFARQAIALPLTDPGKHELAVRIWGAGALPCFPNSISRRAGQWLLAALGRTTQYFPDRMTTPKAQFSFGWDFAPRILSAGIWDDIRLVRVRGAYLAHVRVEVEPLREAEDPTPVRWTVRLKVTRFEPVRLRARVELVGLGDRISLSADTFELRDGEDQVLCFISAAVARWWPWDRGEPHLYRLTVRLFDERGAVDEREEVVGVRTVRRERFPDGRPWRFLLNGRPVFLRGANWVPVDILPGRARPDEYERLIGLARAAGVNFLRVWGGGIREKKAFWDQCSRAGIMAMQEFPLSYAFLDHYPRDARYLCTLESEAEGMVRSLRNHPSLVAWCGGNEISPRRERLPLRTIERVLEREDPSRPWIPASPSEGDTHYWHVWHGGAPWQSLARVAAPFVSEFGLQSLPALETVREMFPSGVPSSLDDPRWSARKAQIGALRRYAGPLDETDIVATIEATQRAQAAALQAGVEACRVRRESSGQSHPCGGLAIWQFNEPWPAVSWSVVDRAGRPKRAYQMLSRVYQPVLVAARFEWHAWHANDQFEAEIWLVNDRAERLDGCTLEAVLDEQRIYLCEDAIVPAASAHRIAAVAVRLSGRPQSLELRLSRQGELLAANCYDLSVYLPPRQPIIGRLIRAAADRLLQID